MNVRTLYLLLLLGIAGLAWRSVFDVDETEVALLSRFGQVQPGQYAPGLHFRLPVDAVLRFDRRVITRAYPGESFLTQDQKSINIDFYLKWRLVDAATFYQATGGDEDVAAQRLSDVVREQLKSAIAQQPLAMVIEDMKLVAVVRAAGAAGGSAQRLGVELADLQLQRIDLSDELSSAVFQRMQQSLAAQAQQLRSQSVAEADRIRADAERRRAQVLADGTREAQRVRGEADLAAANSYSKAYGSNPEFAAFYRSLQAYKNTLGRDGDILVLSPEGEFFKYLHSASGR
ncbi:MAG TPA: protease modulator HflC [Steroidobacteraceae bacterium]|nr:protease modulator HflC [Steroidobacteraceae bacterium]